MPSIPGISIMIFYFGCFPISIINVRHTERNSRSWTIRSPFLLVILRPERRKRTELPECECEFCVVMCNNADPILSPGTVQSLSPTRLFQYQINRTLIGFPIFVHAHTYYLLYAACMCRLLPACTVQGEIVIFGRWGAQYWDMDWIRGRGYTCITAAE